MEEIRRIVQAELDLPKRKNNIALNIAKQTGVKTPSKVLSFF